jgi:hypothetical protein
MRSTDGQRDGKDRQTIIEGNPDGRVNLLVEERGVKGAGDRKTLRAEELTLQFDSMTVRVPFGSGTESRRD